MADNPQQLPRRPMPTTVPTSTPVNTPAEPRKDDYWQALHSSIRDDRKAAGLDEKSTAAPKKPPLHAERSAGMRPPQADLNQMDLKLAELKTATDDKRLEADKPSELDLLKRELARTREQVNELTAALRQYQAPKDAGQQAPKTPVKPDDRQVSSIAPNGAITHTAVKPDAPLPSDLWPYHERQLRTGKYPQSVQVVQREGTVFFVFKIIRGFSVEVRREEGIDEQDKPIVRMQKTMPVEKAYEFWKLLRAQGFLHVPKEITVKID